MRLKSAASTTDSWYSHAMVVRRSGLMLRRVERILSASGSSMPGTEARTSTEAVLIFTSPSVRLRALVVKRSSATGRFSFPMPLGISTSLPAASLILSFASSRSAAWPS